MFYLNTVYSEKKLFEQATNMIQTRFKQLYCCHGYHVTEHVLLSMYATFVCFLLKSFSVLKVSKGALLL